MIAIDAGLGLVFAVLAAVGVYVHRLRRALGAAILVRDQALGAREIANRITRLAAMEMRGLGMTLHGHADQLSASGNPHAAGLAGLSGDCLDLADELQDHAIPAVASRVLRNERIDLGELTQHAVTAAEAALSPGRRNWRISGELSGLMVQGDRRALRAVLGRVLSDAVRHTHQNDWIDVSAAALPHGVSVVVADEGAGLATPEAGAGTPRDSRGVGLRLTLARSLMEAHGGRLDVEAAPRIGTRVTLTFPGDRVLGRGAPVLAASD